jgi:hypothetical protein
MVAKAQTAKYAHLQSGKDVEAFAGHYTPEKEVRLTYGGRELFYVIGHVVVETTCGTGSCSTMDDWYSTVPGYILKWQTEKNKAGLPVTEVELISDMTVQKAIRDIIMKKETVARVDFW